MSRRRIILLLLGLGCLMQAHVRAQTLSTHKALGRYQQFVWQDQHGLPSNRINAMVRTRDGYLWLATLEGAARFDGVRFTVFDNGNTPELSVSTISSLLEDRAGNLWLGTFGGGLLRRTERGFTRYTTAEGLSHNNVRALLEDRDGNLWLGTEGGGLNRFRDGRFTAYTTREGLPDDYVQSLVEAPDGGLWLGTRGGLVRFQEGRFTTYTTREGLPHNSIHALCVDRAGQLWVGTENGLARFQDGRFTVYDQSDGMARDHVWTIYQDRENTLWVGTNRSGLFEYGQGRFTGYTTRDGLPGNSVLTIYQDPDGDLWVDTYDGGLSQLKTGRFRVYADELPHAYANAVFEDSRGHVWMGTRGGFGRLAAGTITHYTMNDGLPEPSGSAITEDRAGHLWVITRGKLSQFSQGRFMPWTSRLPANLSLTTLLGDRAGNLWLGTARDGLLLFRDGRFTAYRELAQSPVISLYEDRAGSLWIGTFSGGVSQFKDGRFTTWTTKDGLANNHVLSFYEDRWGSLWIGTHGGGLSRFKEGKFTTITVNDGLYDNLAFQILSDTNDDSGDLWMSGNRGIYRANLRELNDFAEGRSKAVNSYAYGVADGMLSRECNGGNPAGWKTRDGRLWFPTVRGVVTIDPRQRAQHPPLIAIEAVSIDKQFVTTELFQSAIQTPNSAISIRPSQANLEIDYTALNWSRPQQVRFKYQLAGLDHDWIEAGSRRTAYYSHLPPGEYVFKITADNGEGVWNTEGKSLRITVLPPFYRTWWFLTLATLLVGGAVLGAYEYRVRQLQQKQIAQQAFARQLLESQEGERKRIAAELHDSLGQNLLVIKNRALLNAMTLPDEPARTQFNEFSDAIAQTLEEVRAISHDLRPPHLDQLGLRTALMAMIEKVDASAPLQFTHELGELDGLLPPNDEITLYRIVQESLNNILKHSEATNAEVRIAVHDNELLLTIHDDGRGFTPEDNHRRVGLGLQGIAERARMLGGTHAIQSAPGQGTTVTVRIELTKG